MWRFDPTIGHDGMVGPASGDISVTIGVLPSQSGRRFSITLCAQGKELALRQVALRPGARGHLYRAIRAGFTRLAKG